MVNLRKLSMTITGCELRDTLATIRDWLSTVNWSPSVSFTIRLESCIRWRREKWDSHFRAWTMHFQTTQSNIN